VGVKVASQSLVLDQAVFVLDDPFAAPEPIGSDTNPANTKPAIITRESIKRMSPSQINDNWEAVQKALKSGI